MIPSHVVKSLALVQSIWASTPARLPGTGLQLVRLADLSRGPSLERIPFGAITSMALRAIGGVRDARPSRQATGEAIQGNVGRLTAPGSPRPPRAPTRAPRVDAKWPA